LAAAGFQRLAAGGAGGLGGGAVARLACLSACHPWISPMEFLVGRRGLVLRGV